MANSEYSSTNIKTLMLMLDDIARKIFEFQVLQPICQTIPCLMTKWPSL